MALTGKRRAFADAVLAGSSNKEAAIAAGYSAATASAAGSRLVKDVAVAAYLAVHRSPQPAPAKTATKMATKSSQPDSDVEGAEYEYTVDPESFLTAAMNDPGLEMRMRVDAAKALMPYKHPKLGEGGKKEQKGAAAKTAAKGKFAATPPPLRAVK